MRLRKFGAVLALIAMTAPVAAQTTDLAIGAISGGSGALVARDGKVIPAVPGMKLYSSDRVITRAGGSAGITMASKNCAVTVGASAMLPMSGASCASSNAINFDEGRAGYAGQSSAFQDDHPRGLWVLYAALAAIWGSALYLLLHHDHHHNHPTSP